jgi:hypothetical protein
MQFIFTISNGDVAFCPTDYLEKILERIEREPNKTFLMQSKNPQTFNRVKFPENIILGTTIETNRDELYEKISKAPLPSQRFQDFLQVKHKRKMWTMEPVMDFDIDIIISWVKMLNPCMIWLGYDSKQSYLPEPELNKVKILDWKLSELGYVVILKTIRKSWGENQLGPSDFCHNR